MKALLAVLGTTFMATPAFADGDYRIFPESLSGNVEVARPRCIRAPCPPLVFVETESGKVRVEGSLVDDLAAFEGKTVTVQGKATNRENGAFDGKAFAPGTSSDFITGVVEDKSSCMGGNGPCTTRVLIKVGAETVEVPDAEDAKKIAALDGATVTLRGTVSPPGYRGSRPPMFDLTSDEIVVKGELSRLSHGMNGQTHTLELPNGESLLVASDDALEDLDGYPVWIGGTLSTEPISGQPMLRADLSSQIVFDNSADVFDTVVPGTPSSGVNVGRNASTAASGTGSGYSQPIGYGESSGGGQRR